MKLSKHHNAPLSLLIMQIINLRLLVHQLPRSDWYWCVDGIIENWQGWTNIKDSDIHNWNEVNLFMYDIFISNLIFLIDWLTALDLYSWSKLVLVVFHWLWSMARLPTKLAKLTSVRSIWRSNWDKFRQVYNLPFTYK